MQINTSNGLEIRTDLSANDLNVFEVRLPAAGDLGLQGLEIVRRLAAAVEDLEGSVVDLHLSIKPSDSGTPTISLNLSARDVREISAAEALDPSDSQRSIASLGLSMRTTSALGNKGYLTVGSIISMTPNELLNVGSFGRAALSEVRVALQKLGLHQPAESDMDTPLGASRVTQTA